MIGKSIKVMQISIETQSTLGLSISSIDSGLLVETIAVVPAVAMFGPRTNADPTPFMSTSFAGHMVATAILFNR